MEREHGIESGTGRTAFAVQPTFVIVGAPGTGKRKISNELAENHFTEKLAVNEMNPSTFGVALGLMADYRTEIKIAADRATSLSPTDMPVLYTHSLIDSLAYSLVRLEGMIEYEVGSDRTHEQWALTMATIGLMLTDTFKAEEVIFLHGDFEKDSDNDRLQDMIENILEGYEVNYTYVEVKDLAQATEDVAAVIEGYIG